MSWNHTTTNLSARCRKRSEISEGNKLYVSIVRSILRPNSSSEFMRYFCPLRLIFQFTLQVVNISNISFFEKFPRGKVLHEAVWEIRRKTRSQKNVLLFSFSFPFLLFSSPLLFGCFFQLFYCLPTLLQKSCSSNHCHLIAICQTGVSERGYRCLCLQGFTGINFKIGQEFSHNHSQPKRAQNFHVPDENNLIFLGQWREDIWLSLLSSR